MDRNGVDEETKFRILKNMESKNTKKEYFAEAIGSRERAIRAKQSGMVVKIDLEGSNKWAYQWYHLPTQTFYNRVETQWEDRDNCFCEALANVPKVP